MGILLRGVSLSQSALALGDVPVPFLGSRKHRGDEVPTGDFSLVQMTLRDLRHLPGKPLAEQEGDAKHPKFMYHNKRRSSSFPEQCLKNVCV